MREIYEWAQKYRALGWNVIPLYNYSKNPAPLQWKIYQDRMSTDAEFEQWFNNDRVTGLGLITGKLSGIVVLDEDTYKEGGIPVKVKTGMLGRTARGGLHHYFKYVEPIRSSGLKKGIFVEIKADGGFVVLPPSKVLIEEKEGRYEWLEKCYPEELLEIREEQLAPYRGNQTEAVNVKELRFAPLGTQHNTLRSIALSVFARFKREEWEVAEDVIRMEAAKFVPPHPEGRVEKMIEDCKKYILTHNKKQIEDEIASEPAVPSGVNALVEERIADRKLEAGAPETGWPELDKLIKGFIPGHIYTLTGDTNVGKCEGSDTPHLMFDGSIKMVQNLQVGDLLMGPDNKPRKVLSTTTGEDEMFLIQQDWGLSYVVNKDHILSLKCSTISREKKYYKEYEAGKIINIPVKDYLQKSGNFKKFTRGWHVGVDFKEQQVLVDPYFLGLWLGDGHTGDVSISTTDQEVVRAVMDYAASLNLLTLVRKDRTCLNIRVTTGKRGNCQNIDSLQKRLRTIGVLGNKHIPENYRINSRAMRLELLAGLIDTDGWVSRNKSKNTAKECFSYMISVVNKRLADDILLLACSLGFNARIGSKMARMKRANGTIYSVICYTVSIQGNLAQIPVRIPRKKITSVRTKAVGFSSFKVIPQGRGKYFGFTLNEDGLYLLSDCTVTHNTTIACNFAEALRQKGKKTLYIALEPDVNLVEYLASVRLQKPFDEITDEDLYLEKEDGYIQILLQRSIKSVDDLIRTLKGLPDRFDLIVIDHIGYFVRTEHDWVQQQSNVIKELAFLAKEHKSAVMLIAHLRKPGFQKKNQDWVPTQNDIAGSAAFKQDSTEVMIAYRPTKQEDQFAVEFADRGALLVTKTKVGPNGSLPLIFTERSAKIWSLEEAKSTVKGRMMLEEKSLSQHAQAMEASAPWAQDGD